MGINGLVQFLKKTEPNLVVDVPLSSFNGHRLAVDASVYLYKFVCIDNQLKGQWIDLFINFIIWIRKNNIRPVFLFDGKPPIQKERTQKERRANRYKISQKIEEIENILEILDDWDINKPLTEDLDTRIFEILKTNIMSRKEIIFELNNCCKKENSKNIIITPEHNHKIQNLLTFLGLPWFKANGEAERACSWLCKWDYVKGVITSDSDVLAYGVPIFIQDVRINSNECKIIRHQDVLQVLDLTESQFRDFCIMCGTDYNKRMVGIGPVKAYNLLCKHDNLDNIDNTTIDTTILYHLEGRQLFTLPDKEDFNAVIDCFNGIKFIIPPIKKIDTGNLTMFLIKNNSNFTIEEIEKYTFQPTFLIK